MTFSYWTVSFSSETLASSAIDFTVSTVSSCSGFFGFGGHSTASVGSSFHVSSVTLRVITAPFSSSLGCQAQSTGVLCFVSLTSMRRGSYVGVPGTSSSLVYRFACVVYSSSPGGSPISFAILSV